jgi:5'-nucleotidase
MIRRSMSETKLMHPGRLAALTAVLCLCSGGCATSPANEAAPAPEPADGAAPASASSRGLTLLQINDTYKIEGLRGGREGGMGRVRRLRSQIEDEGRDVVLLHAGDLLFPSVMSKYLNGAPMVDALNLLDGSPDFDERMFVTFGNHEFDKSDPQIFYDRLVQSRFRWVSSNVLVRPAADAEPRPLGERFPNVLDHAVVDAGGVRVGIFGLTLDDQKRPWIDYGFEEPRRRATIERVLDQLERQGAEFVVALTHQGLSEDLWLAREYGDRIDWIAGGHEHVYIRRQVGATAITKADADASSAIRIDLERRDGRIVATDARIELGADRQVDPAMAGQVAKSLVELEGAVREKTGRGLLEVVATTEHLLEGTEPAIRGRETALGDFLCDVLRARFGTDIAFVNGGAIRVNDDIPAGGDLRVYELEGIFYYDDQPVILDLRGSELLALLTRSVSEADLGHGRFLQLSGVRFRYHVRAEGPPTVDPSEVFVAERASGRFAPLELERAYRVATMSYIWKYGSRDDYPIFSGGDGGTSPPLVEQPAISWRALTEEAIAALPNRRITTAVDGRIERVALPR